MAGQTRIGQFLKSKGSNQCEAAKVIGKSAATFSMKANGYSQFKQDEIKALAKHYEMTPEEVMETFM